MGFLIGILMVLLVFFMVFAMALAEWQDKDPGEFFAPWLRRWFPARPVASVVSPLPAPKGKPARKKIAGKSTTARKVNAQTSRKGKGK